MGTPYDRKILFVYWRAATMQGFSQGDQPGRADRELGQCIRRPGA
jgi:hypothetical protein